MYHINIEEFWNPLINKYFNKNGKIQLKYSSKLSKL